MNTEDWGFPEVVKPGKSRPEIPSDITMIDDEGLMALFSELTLWADYATVVLTERRIEESECERVSKDDWHFWFVEARDSNENVTDARSQADRKVSSTYGSRKAQLYAARKAMETALTNLERDSNLVSRELSRRLAEKSGPPRRRRFGA